MTSAEIIRSWKDDEFRSTLSRSRQRRLPPNPAGMVELTDEQLLGVDGGSLPPTVLGCTFDIICALLSLDPNPCPQS